MYVESRKKVSVTLSAKQRHRWGNKHMDTKKRKGAEINIYATLTGVRVLSRFIYTLFTGARVRSRFIYAPLTGAHC